MAITQTVPVLFSSVSTGVPYGGAGPLGNLTLFNNNKGRTEMYIQMIGSGSNLLVALNTNPAAYNNCNFILRAASATNEADGMILNLLGYTGPVTVSGGHECRFIAWENGAGVRS